MLLSSEEWMDLRAFRALLPAGTGWAEIARETGHDWRTVKKYLAADTSAGPPAVARDHPTRLTDPWASTIDEMLTLEPKLQTTVIYDRLRRYHGYAASYQRVKLNAREARERICPKPPSFTAVMRPCPALRPRWTGGMRERSGPLLVPNTSAAST